MPSLALVCTHTNVLMTVCHPSSSEVGSRFISAMGTIGNSGITTGSDTTGRSTFLFRTFGTGVRVASDDLDLLYRL